MEWHPPVKISERIYIETDYKHGELHGDYKRWYRNRQKWIEAHYFEGKKDSEYIRWDTHGKISQQEIYDKGKLVKRIKP